MEKYRLWKRGEKEEREERKRRKRPERIYNLRRQRLFKKLIPLNRPSGLSCWHLGGLAGQALPPSIRSCSCYVIFFLSPLRFLFFSSPLQQIHACMRMPPPQHTSKCRSAIGLDITIRMQKLVKRSRYTGSNLLPCALVLLSCHCVWCSNSCTLEFVLLHAFLLQVNYFSLCSARLHYNKNSLVQWNWFSVVNGCMKFRCIQCRQRTNFIAPGCIKFSSTVSLSFQIIFLPNLSIVPTPGQKKSTILAMHHVVLKHRHSDFATIHRCMKARRRWQVLSIATKMVLRPRFSVYIRMVRRHLLTTLKYTADQWRGNHLSCNRE